jgi:3-deoxy-D-manno-octulosonic-acid transferase
MTDLPTGLFLYRAATAALEPLAPAVLAHRARRGKEDPERVDERLARAAVERPDGPLVWLHGASVGEGLSLLPLVEALKLRAPAANLLVTSGTVTSAELLGRRLPTGAVHRYAPVDAPGVAARFLDQWRPDAVVLAESELWPNLVIQAQTRGARLAMLSARLSEKSLKGWRRSPASARRLLGAFDLVMAQDDAGAAALARLGARDDGRLNLKLAGEPLPVDDLALERARAAAAGRPVLVAASTHAGEEAIILDAFAAVAGHPAAPLLVIVPRHPVRGPAVALLAAERGVAVRRQGAGEPFDGRAAVHVADGLGELGLWFRLAGAALVGGSLIDGLGGHNPLEPARLGAPILVGPYVRNWRSVYEAMGERVVAVRDGKALGKAFAAALDDPAAARARAEAARAYASIGARAVDAAAERLAALLP